MKRIFSFLTIASMIFAAAACEEKPVTPVDPVVDDPELVPVYTTFDACDTDANAGTVWVNTTLGIVFSCMNSNGLCGIERYDEETGENSVFFNLAPLGQPCTLIAEKVYATPINISADAEGGLALDLYYRPLDPAFGIEGNPDFVNPEGTKWIIEISSSGKAGENSLIFNYEVSKTNQLEWNEIAIDFENASAKGNIDFSKVNYFGLSCTGIVDWGWYFLDNVRTYHYEPVAE